MYADSYVEYNQTIHRQAEKCVHCATPQEFASVNHELGMELCGSSGLWQADILKIILKIMPDHHHGMQHLHRKYTHIRKH